MAVSPCIYILSVLLLVLRSTLCIDIYKHEALHIMKRMAEEGESFTDHDVAQVHLLKGRGQHRVRLAKRDVSAIRNTTGRGKPTHLQLDLSKGFKINVTVTLSNILSEDTVLSFKNADGHTQTKLNQKDCYSFGSIEDSSGKGWIAISHHDGIFGFASSPDFEYFFHPVGSNRHKRDTADDLNIYVMWRYLHSEDLANRKYDFSDRDESLVFDKSVITRVLERPNNHLTATKFVIEMAMFSDEQYWKTLHKMYPGRESDFLLTRLAGTQALFGNREKVGYDVQIKVKLLEYWTKNPENYTFTEKFGKNLRSFCQHTAFTYFYDVLALNTGIVRDGSLVGLAYVGGTCTKQRCLVLKGHDFGSFVGFSHELGHSLGMHHQNTADCPEKMKSEGGFMGGGAPLNFSPCMKYQLDKFLNSSKSNCLFTETGITKTSKAFLKQPSLFPGQAKSPNVLCFTLAGPGYRYVPNEIQEGGNVCHWFVCLNENKRSPEFGRARRFFAPVGFPCRSESFCRDQNSCAYWNRTLMALEADTLREMTKIPQWSRWSRRFSPCSRTCGVGVRVRRRECRYFGSNLSPYCPGRSMIAALCKKKPCVGDPENSSKNVSLVRQVRGNEVCSRFLQNNVSLVLKYARGYLPTASELTLDDIGHTSTIGQSKSCLLKCDRDPITAKGDLDAFMPDGTPCRENKRPWYDLDRFKISMNCIRGQCTEFAKCHPKAKSKDHCGICGGDGSRCVDLIFNSTYNVPRLQHIFLTDVPARSIHIDVFTKRKNNEGLVLELWSKDGKVIIGDKGTYSRLGVFIKSNAVPFAGTKWWYDPKVAYLRARGPTNSTVTLKALRMGPPMKKIELQYARPVGN